MGNGLMTAFPVQLDPFALMGCQHLAQQVIIAHMAKTRYPALLELTATIQGMSSLTTAFRAHLGIFATSLALHCIQITFALWLRTASKAH